MLIISEQEKAVVILASCASTISLSCLSGIVAGGGEIGAVEVVISWLIGLGGVSALNYFDSVRWRSDQGFPFE